MDPYVGEIRIFAGYYAPEGWAFCDGSSLNVNDYPLLYALIGNLYGGTPNVNFNLPNLISTVPVGQGVISGGTNSYALAATGGADEVTIAVANLPAHSHTINATSAAATLASPSGNLLAQSNGAGGAYPYVKRYTALPVPNGGATAPNAQMDPAAITTSVGGGAAHNNLQPYLAINYIIALNGIFPSSS